MGASFRNIGQIEGLAGLDFLTISPALLGQLAGTVKPLEPALHALQQEPLTKLSFIGDHAAFQDALSADLMASQLLHQGIDKFAEDARKLKELLVEAMNCN